MQFKHYFLFIVPWCLPLSWKKKKVGHVLFFRCFYQALFVYKIESITNIIRKTFHDVCGLDPYVFGDIDKLGDGFVSFITRAYLLGTYLAESLPV